MSSEGDRASVLRTIKVRTKLKGDGSWLQRQDEPQAETQEEEKPWLAEVRDRRLNGTPIETSPVSSPVMSTPPPVKSDSESKPATQGYLIRGVFTKLETPVSTPSYNGTSIPKTFTKRPSETYKRIAPHIVRNTSENPEGQLSFEEQERRTEAALHVMKTKAERKRSYVMSAAKLYETKDTPPDTSLATSSPSFVAKRVEIFDDADSTVEPSPAVSPTSAASAPAPKPQTASSIDTIAALSDTLISLDTNPSSAENNKQELAEEEESPMDSPTPEDSVEQEPDTAPRDSKPITGDLLGFSDGPEEPAEPVPSSPGRWSQDLLTGLGSLSMQQQEEEKQTDETAVETQSSADPFDPNPIGTASHNSPPDLFEPSADVSINSSAATEETRECPSPEVLDYHVAVPEILCSCPNEAKPTITPVGVEQVILKIIPSKEEPKNNGEEEEKVEEEELVNVVEKQLHLFFLQEEKVEGENEEDKVEEDEENEEEEKVEEKEENEEEDKVQKEEENEEEEKVEEDEENEEEDKVQEEDEKVEEEENEQGKVDEEEDDKEEEKVKEDEEGQKVEEKKEDKEEKEKVEEEEESKEEQEDEMTEEDEDKDEESSEGSWTTTWEIPHETSTVESQEAKTEDKAGDQQTVIMFERKSTENDSPWDKWTSPTVYTISTGTGDGDEEEVEEEERPAVVVEERRVPTPEPEPESKKPFVYVKEYVDASEHLLNLSDPLNGSDDFASSSISYSYSSPSSYTRVSLSSTCTYCGKQVGNDAKISIEHLNINCHPECFKCDVCSRPMGDLLHSMFLHKKKVHCESCYATVI
ncbi:zinc finger protein 185 [Xiphophorus maculatus]|uniref:Zinc finger protein 185 with LIM domain n=1 Tax=Xiphophorus maculatus TaxID=8083 RepID=A0A3B5QXN9_XIPMA|nr:zinc finger protein 185 [Xiphophorus maculatus]